MSAMGTMHVQLGPAFQAVVFAELKKDQALREQLEKAFNDHPFDPSAASTDWPKSSLCARGGGDGGDGSGGGGAGAGGGLVLEIPKMDLMAELPNDCISKMVRNGFSFSSILLIFIETRG